MSRTLAGGMAASGLWVGAMGLLLALGFNDPAAAQAMVRFGAPMGGYVGFEAPAVALNPNAPGYEFAACPGIAPVLLSIRVKVLANADSQIKSFRFFKLETFCGVEGSRPALEQAGAAFGTSDIPVWQFGEGAQSLSPITLLPGTAATLLNLPRIRTGPVLLIPQTLPPGGLLQAPSSLR